MDDLKSMRVFLEVVDQLSFAAAARRLAMTAASVTRMVAKLENDLGQQLLLRTTRQVALTADGAVVAARMRPILAEWDRAYEDLSARQDAEHGRIRISAPLSFGIQVMPAVLEGFNAHYPQVDLDIQLTDTLIDVIDSDLDLAVRISGPPSDKSTIWRKICEVPRVAVAAPSLFEDVARPEVPEDIPQTLALSYSETGHGELWHFSKDGHDRTVRAGRQVLSNNGDVLYGLARAGVGVAVLPEFMVASGLASGEIECVLPEWRLSSLWLTLYYPPYAKLPPLVATFSDYFERFILEQDGLAGLSIGGR
ncbi:MAG: LysR family transcriptional regulator [Marinovum sp.]|nr:LysR family transcriptional regulator [Marinovum sp.]